MIIIGVRAKVKNTGEYIEHRITLDDKLYKTDDDTIYGFVSDFLDEKHGDIFKWFRFWRIS